MLVGWTMFAWANEGFEPTYQKVQALSLKQVAVVHEFSDASFSNGLTRWLTPNLRNQSSLALNKAQNARENLTQIAKAQMGAFVEQNQAPLAPEFIEMVDDFQLKTHQFWMLLKATGHLLLIKLAIIGAAMPLFLLALTAGLVDGLNQRAIRTASLGRESTYVFHKSIPIARRALFWVLGLWLALPHALPPTPVFVSLSVLLALLASVTSSRFKKYL